MRNYRGAKMRQKEIVKESEAYPSFFTNVKKEGGPR